MVGEETLVAYLLFLLHERRDAVIAAPQPPSPLAGGLKARAALLKHPLNDLPRKLLGKAAAGPAGAGKGAAGKGKDVGAAGKGERASVAAARKGGRKCRLLWGLEAGGLTDVSGGGLAIPEEDEEEEEDADEEDDVEDEDAESEAEKEEARNEAASAKKESDEAAGRRGCRVWSVVDVVDLVEVASGAAGKPEPERTRMACR